MQGAQLDFDRFGSQIGKALLKFSVKNEGEIGIKLLLQLEELEFLPCPRTHLYGRTSLSRECRVPAHQEHPDVPNRSVVREPLIEEEIDEDPVPETYTREERSNAPISMHIDAADHCNAVSPARAER